MSLFFRVTDAGLAAATSASSQGLRLAITRFKLGTSYGYTPTGTETALAGAVVYDETISSYRNMPDGSIIFVCSVVPSAGPFNFGEIGIYTDTGLLFAVGTFPSIQEKYVSTGSSVNSTYTFNCHMTLTQRATQFNLAAATVPDSQIYMRWDQVVPLTSMPDPRVLRVVINEADSRGNLPTLSATPSGGWSLDGGFMEQLGSTLTPVTTTTSHVELSATAWASLVPGNVAQTVSLLSAQSTMVVQVGSSFRRVTPAVVGSNVRLTYSVALGSAAANFKLFTNIDVYDLFLQTVPNATVLGRTTAGSGNVEALAPDTARDLIGGVPPGAIVHFSRNSPPTGWLTANGAAVSRTVYAGLFSAIGTTFGSGDGSTTFNLPDLRGEFIRSWDNGRGVDSGRGFASWQDSANRSHNHSAWTDTQGWHGHNAWTDGQGQHSHDVLGGLFAGDSKGLHEWSASSVMASDNQTNYSYRGSMPATGWQIIGGAGNHAHNVGIEGNGDHAHNVGIGSDGTNESRPRNLALLACIKF